MSHAAWTFVNANIEPLQAFGAAFQGEFGAATEHRVILDDAFGSKVVFKGDFVVINGVVQSGTVTGFDIFENSIKVVKAKGYALSFDAVKEAVDWAHNHDTTHARDLLDVKTTFQGSLYADGIFADRDNPAPLHLLGKGGDDRLSGGHGDDVLKGGAGSDFLTAWDGKDTLYGGSGRDTFWFRDDLSGISRDKITDFQPGKDTILLEEHEFAALTPGELLDSEFQIGKHAKDADDHVIYNASSGGVFYDADGAGGAVQIRIGVLGKGLDLTHGDFLVEAFG